MWSSSQLMESQQFPLDLQTFKFPMLWKCHCALKEGNIIQNHILPKASWRSLSCRRISFSTFLIFWRIESTAFSAARENISSRVFPEELSLTLVLALPRFPTASKTDLNSRSSTFEWCLEESGLDFAPRIPWTMFWMMFTITWIGRVSTETRDLLSDYGMLVLTMLNMYTYIQGILYKKLCKSVKTSSSRRTYINTLL